MEQNPSSIRACFLSFVEFIFLLSSNWIHSTSAPARTWWCGTVLILWETWNERTWDVHKPHAVKAVGTLDCLKLDSSISLNTFNTGFSISQLLPTLPYQQRRSTRPHTVWLSTSDRQQQQRHLQSLKRHGDVIQYLPEKESELDNLYS